MVTSIGEIIGSQFNRLPFVLLAQMRAPLNHCQTHATPKFLHSLQIHTAHDKPAGNV